MLVADAANRAREVTKVSLNGAADLLIVPRSRCHGLAVCQAVHAALEFLWILQIIVNVNVSESNNDRSCWYPNSLRLTICSMTATTRQRVLLFSDK